jgi:hypothetical protein
MAIRIEVLHEHQTEDILSFDEYIGIKTEKHDFDLFPGSSSMDMQGRV